MNKLTTLISALLFLITIIGCQKKEQPPRDSIIIAGKIQNYHDSIEAPQLAVNHIFLEQVKYDPEMDIMGNFRFEFKSDLPTDAWLVFDPYFILVAKPGDSLYLDLVLEDTVIFSGDRAIENQNVYEFQNQFQELKNGFGKLSSILNEMDQDGFGEKMDSIKNDIDHFLEDYITKNEISDSYLKDWITIHAVSYYYDYLNFFIIQNRDKPVDKIQERIQTFLPLNERVLYSPSEINAFVNYYNYTGIVHQVINVEGIKNPSDSLMMERRIQFEKDPLLRQLLIAERVANEFEEYDTSRFSIFWERIDTLLDKSYVRGPLLARYQEVKKQLEKTRSMEGEFIANDKFISTDLIDSIVLSNKGSLVYMDLWATWCGPCIYEFKNGKDFKNKLEGQPISFVYVCAQSKSESGWKAMIDKYNLKGINLFLNKQQFNDFDDRYEITGFPTYFIFDKTGELVEKGFEWRPSNPQTLERIKGLL